MADIRRLRPYIGGRFVESATEKYTDVFDPSVGEVISQAPCCTKDEVEQAIAAAKAACPGWSDTPTPKRAQLMFKLRNLIEEHMDELTMMVARGCKNFEEGLALMNENPFANGSVIFTQNGFYAREFVKRTDGGMVGVNVGIPVPIGIFSFSGHKQSFFMNRPSAPRASRTGRASAHGQSGWRIRHRSMHFREYDS